jgi:hypothetical protein
MRGAPRWLTVLAMLAMVAALGAFALHRALAPAALAIAVASSTLPADGFTSTAIRLRWRYGARHGIEGNAIRFQE